jgi:hypothetical protein
MLNDQIVDDLLASLKVIGMLDDAQPKLRLRDGRLALGHGTALWRAPGLWRWLAGDSRGATFAAVRAVVANAIQLHADTDPGTWLGQRLVAELRGARRGIDRLQTTYAADSLAVAQLAVLAERIDAAVGAE